jgi:hydrogenase maturation protease
MRVLVAGIGNIFLGDDGFGVEVVSRLADLRQPDVVVADYGIRGVHLALELLDGYDVLVLVDALPMGEPPGTVAVVELDIEASGAGDGPRPVMDAHSMNPATVLDMLGSMGGQVGQVLVIGCEPLVIEEGMGLSAPVAAAVDAGAAAVRDLLAEIGSPTEERSRA